MARISELSRLIQQLQAEGYSTREIARAARLALQPAVVALSRADVELREAARGASAELGQAEAQLAAARRRLRKIEREAAKSRRGLGAALKREARPKRSRRTKPLRKLSPAYRKRIRRGLAAGKTRQEAGGHAPGRSGVLRQLRAARGPIHIRWENVTFIVSPPNEITNRTVQATIPEETLARVRERGTIGALWKATMERYVPDAELVSYGSVQMRPA